MSPIDDDDVRVVFVGRPPWRELKKLWDDDVRDDCANVPYAYKRRLQMKKFVEMCVSVCNLETHYRRWPSYLGRDWSDADDTGGEAYVSHSVDNDPEWSMITRQHTGRVKAETRVVIFVVAVVVT